MGGLGRMGGMGDGGMGDGFSVNGFFENGGMGRMGGMGRLGRKRVYLNYLLPITYYLNLGWGDWEIGNWGMGGNGKNG